MDIRAAFRYIAALRIDPGLRSSQKNSAGVLEMPFAKLLPREEQYVALFAQRTSYINDAAKTLVEMMAHSDGDYQEFVQRIKSIEHACDDLTHNVATRLNQSFITPFDREDIFMMSKALDDVVDLIDGAARAI